MEKNLIDIDETDSLILINKASSTSDMFTIVSHDSNNYTSNLAEIMLSLYHNPDIFKELNKRIEMKSNNPFEYRKLIMSMVEKNIKLKKNTFIH